MLEARGLFVGHPGAEPGMPPAAGPVDLTLAPGEWVGLVGGNGSGKTALFLTLAGLAPPLKGTVTIDGLDPWAKGEGLRARERVGVVFQEPETQFVTDRVARELAFPLENLGWARPAIETRVRELLATFDLGALAEAPPERLSGGEMQRVALAAAAAPRPRYLLLDEPASYLDRAGRDALVAWTRQRCLEDGCAVLWSECDPALTAEAGRVVTLPGPVGERATRDSVLPPAAVAPRPAGDPLWNGEGLTLTRRDARGTVTLWGGLDLDVRAGDRVAIVGANGSGKTALLDLLAGWEKPSTGRLTSPPLNERGYVTQFPEYQLFAPTALEDVSFGLTHRGGRRKESPTAVAARANAALAAAGLDPVLCARAAPESLSLGERRRLALAGVLVTEPVALLLDEPTAGLDPDAIAGLFRALARAGERGAGVVVATHDRAAARAWGARIVELPEPDRTARGT